jgi:tryptophanyl-tRNA synthetase
VLAERIVAHYAPARERYQELLGSPRTLDDVLAEGAERIRPLAQATIDEVRDKMGLR